LVIAESRPEVRSALRLLIEQHGEISVTAEAARASELLEQVQDTCPDAILLDCDLPGLSVKQSLPQLRSVCPRVRVVALCSRSEMQQTALSAGADAFFCKTESPEKLIAVLRQSLEQVKTSGSGSRPPEDRCHQIRDGKEPQHDQTT